MRNINSNFIIGSSFGSLKRNICWDSTPVTRRLFLKWHLFTLLIELTLDMFEILFIRDKILLSVKHLQLIKIPLSLSFIKPSYFRKLPIVFIDHRKDVYLRFLVGWLSLQLFGIVYLRMWQLNSVIIMLCLQNIFCILLFFKNRFFLFLILISLLLLIISSDDPFCQVNA